MAAYTTIDDPSAYFKVQLYTGNGSANHAITFDDTDTDVQPDLVWIKDRDDNIAHCWFDSVRGATKVIHCHSSVAETTDTDTLDSFTSDGFQVDADTKVNTNTDKYVAFCWKESATAGFDIVSFTGNGSARTISHSLSAVPHLMIVKSRDDDDNFMTYLHRMASDPETDKMKLDETVAIADDATVWNDTAPTSSVFSVGTSNATNKSSSNIIAYLFSEKQGFSKFGKYTGNGNVDGPFIYTGFRPAFFFMKRTDTGSNWTMFHNRSTPGNEIYVSQDVNVLNDEDADTGYNDVDFCANGVKIREDNNDLNASGAPIIYVCFAEAPLVNSNGVPCNAR